MRKRYIKTGLACCLAAGLAALAPATAAPGTQSEAASKASLSRALGDSAWLKLYRDEAETGIMLHNSSRSTVTVQDTVSLSAITLKPGDRIGLSAEATRHLAITVGNAVIYESVERGSTLSIGSDTEVEQ